MLDLKFIRENIKKVNRSLKERGEKISLDELLQLDDERRRILAEVEDLKRSRNEASEVIG